MKVIEKYSHPWVEDKLEKLGIEGEEFLSKNDRMMSKNLRSFKKMDVLVKNSLENIDEANPKWSYLASDIYVNYLYDKVNQTRGFKQEDYGQLYQLIEQLIQKGVYNEDLMNKYTKQEIEELGNSIVKERDELFDYLGLFLMKDRYLAKDRENNVLELPQERFMIVSMWLMKEETEDRLSKVKEAYWALSNLYMTVATPTMNNAGKTHGQLSSCFIDTMDDNLKSIYGVNTDTAKLSKNGGGVGVYVGKVRSKGSSIKGYKNKSSGVVPWIRQLNNTAVSVDQLGQRKGAVAIYLDVFHKDIESFLDLKLNNGDERQRAHDIFTGVNLPDLFMEKLQEKDENGKSIGEWNLFCPHQVKEIMGWKDEKGNALGLEDFYDETDKKYFKEKYEEAVNTPELPRQTVKAMDLMKRIMVSQLETGTPYMFYRDEVNRKNANKHVRGKGLTSVYCSNLCTEITQNMSATKFIEEEIEDEDIFVERKQSGDFVVCNLSSINLGKAVKEDVIERVIKIQVRMLDNVIDINTLPVKQAEITNKKYRSVGLGTFGWHQLLAQKGVEWESEDAVELTDKVYDKIAYHTIKMSNELAKERGSYKYFKGSEWETGDYFKDRGYLDGSSKEWEELASEVQKHGMRNGYLMAVAPNTTTANIADSTSGIDPVFQPFYNEEKKDFKIPKVAPDMDHNTYNIYRRSAYIVDQRWSIEQNAARQRHVDQSISFNLFVPNTIKASMVLELHLKAWSKGLKTSYYLRSTANEVEECDWCQ